MKPLSHLLACGLAILLISGCAHPPQPPPPGSGANNGQSSAAGSPTVSRNSFLYTGYQPLEKWMDERFKVRYENMPLKLVFDQQPISDIVYELVNLPENTSLFYLVRPSISRREILQEISRFFDLEMDVDMAGGKPNKVIVRGKGRRVSGDPFLSLESPETVYTSGT